jgi:DNA-binding NarL/FixJ family response regulator
VKNQRKIAVLVSSGHPVFLDGLRVCLGSHPQIEVLGEAKGVAEAVTKTLALRPDVLLLDISPEDRAVPQMIRRMKQEHSLLKVIVLSLGGGATEHIAMSDTALVRAQNSMSELIELIYALGSIRTQPRGERAPQSPQAIRTRTPRAERKIA